MTTQIIQWLFLTYGITLVITISKIFRPVRMIDPTGLLKCPMCTGWWIGLLLSLVFEMGLFSNTSSYAPDIHEVIRIRIPWGAFANAFSASGWCWIIHVVLTRLGADKL